MEIKEAQDKLFEQYVSPSNGIYGVGITDCPSCGKQYLEVMMDANKKELFDSIPKKFYGYRVEKVFSGQPVAQADFKPTKIKITKKGVKVIQHAPIVGGYIPENIFLLLLIMDGKAHEIERLATSKRKFMNLDGLIKYLETKGLLVTNEDSIIKDSIKNNKITTTKKIKT